MVHQNSPTVEFLREKIEGISNFVWEIWHYKIRVEDIDSAI